MKEGEEGEFPLRPLAWSENMGVHKGMPLQENGCYGLNEKATSDHDQYPT